MICNKLGVGERMCAKKGLRNRTKTSKGEKSGQIHFDIFIVQINVISCPGQEWYFVHVDKGNKTGG